MVNRVLLLFLFSFPTLPISRGYHLRLGNVLFKKQNCIVMIMYANSAALDILKEKYLALVVGRCGCVVVLCCVYLYY